MSWEGRRKGNYYYRARRVNGRVIKEYIGSGAEAEEAAKRDVEAREAARKRDKAFLAFQKENDKLEVMFQIVDICIEVLMEHTMTAAGYHRTNRGPWRKKRVKKDAAAITPPPVSEPQSANPAPEGLAAPPTILPQSG